MINAGKYNHKIEIYQVTIAEDTEGFRTKTESLVLSPWASVKTTSGYTLLTSNTDFEKALTNFTIRYSSTVTRDMLVKYNGKTYTIEYLNNIDEKGVELEMQCKEVTK